MIKTYERYLIKLFLKKFVNIFLIFFALVFILSIFDEISFFKNTDVKILFPFLMTALNTPSILFEVFPFIFLISAQFFFIELIYKNELEVLKVNGLNNLKIIKIISLSSFVLGIFLILFYYNFSSKLKFIYLDLKNTYSNDNKYLAVVTENGLWIKDEIDEKIFIINAKRIKDNYLEEVAISEFTLQFDLINLILSKKVNISNNKWILNNTKLSKNNGSEESFETYEIATHFNKDKINGLFRNLTALNISQLIKLNNDYKTLGYSTIETRSHLSKLSAFPFYVSIVAILSSVIMLNIKRDKSIVFHIILGIFLSVTIYYLYFLFNLFGENAKIPVYLSTWLPLLMLIFLISIGLVRINEK
jgi:lipopolysaccharide export system permease protein